MKKIILAVLAVGLMIAGASTADAKGRHGHRGHHGVHGHHEHHGGHEHAWRHFNHGHGHHMFMMTSNYGPGLCHWRTSWHHGHPVNVRVCRPVYL